MPGVVQRSCAAALLVHGCFMQGVSAQPTAASTPITDLKTLQKAAPLQPLGIASQQTSLQEATSAAQLSSDAASIIGGMTEAFLGSKKVSDRERTCLASGASTLAAAVTQSSADAVNAFHTAQGGLQQQQLQQLQEQPMVAPVPVPLAFNGTAPFVNGNATELAGGSAYPYIIGPTAAPGMTAGTEMVITMEFAARFAGILELEKELAKNCLKEDAVKTLESAAQHMGNVTYMGGRLIANGVDILTELTDATSAYDAGNMRKFGEDLGGAWRKVVLSKRSALDFEMPSAQDVDEMTQGLVASLFGNGMILHVATDAGYVPRPPYPVPQLRGAAVYQSPYVSPYQQSYPAMPTAVNIDLRNCLVANMPLFRSAWAPVFKLFLDASGKTWQDAAEKELTDSSELLISMFDLQVALRTCGLGPQQEAVLLDAMHIGSAHAKLELPEMRSMSPQQERDSMEKSFTEAMQDWKEHSWSAFGAQLGSILRDFLVITFPQKWSVDDAGRLRNLLEETESDRTIFSQHIGSSVSVLSCALLGMMLFVLGSVVLAVRRTQRVQVTALASTEEEAQELQPQQRFLACATYLQEDPLLE